MVQRRVLIRAVIAASAGYLVAMPWSHANDRALVSVFKLPDCICCKNWIKYLESRGYQVTATNVPDVAGRTAIQDQYGVPSHLRGCHTAVVEGYVVEGHVSHDEIDRLLHERPPIKGLFVKGMPKGSPGMEGGEPERYNVIAVDAEGRETVWATHGPE